MSLMGYCWARLTYWWIGSWHLRSESGAKTRLLRECLPIACGSLGECFKVSNGSASFRPRKIIVVNPVDLNHNSPYPHRGHWYSPTPLLIPLPSATSHTVWRLLWMYSYEEHTRTHTHVHTHRNALMDGSWSANWNFLWVKPEVGPAGRQAAPHAELRLQLCALLRPTATLLCSLLPYVDSWQCCQIGPEIGSNLATLAPGSQKASIDQACLPLQRTLARVRENMQGADTLTHTHMNTHTHRKTGMHTHTHIHRNTQTHVHTHRHTHLHTHTNTQANTCAQAQT